MTGQTIPAVVLAQAEATPDSIAFVEGDQRTTYGELAGLIDGAARAMLHAGITHGDRVGMWAPNSVRWVVAALGAQAVGATLVPINTRYKTAEAAHPLRRTGADLIVAANGFMGIDAESAASAAATDGRTPARIVDLAAPADRDHSWDAFVEAGAGVDPSRWRAALDRVGPDDLSDIMFTSGSTGLPKGVRHRHGPSVRQTFNTIAENGIEPDDRYLIVNPFFHVFGYTGGWVPALFLGCTVYPLPVFDVDEVLGLIQRERITYFPGPPTIFHSLLEHPRLDEFDITSLRLSLTGSADVPVDLIRQMLERLTFDRVIQAYGMTECGTATYTLPTDAPEVVATTVGVACTDMEVRVVDPANKPVAADDEGEIVVRGYAVTDGYFDDPDATAAAIDDDGWLHTGDRGTRDDAGYVKVLGRMSDMFIVGGFNVYPAEVEDMIRQNPAVEDVAVVAVPDTRMGEVGCAFVIGRGPVDADELVDWCRSRMANFKAPRYVRVIETFPLTGSNKVSKPDLRELAAAEGIGGVSES